MSSRRVGTATDTYEVSNFYNHITLRMIWQEIIFEPSIFK